MVIVTTRHIIRALQALLPELTDVQAFAIDNYPDVYRRHVISAQDGKTDSELRTDLITYLVANVPDNPSIIRTLSNYLTQAPKEHTMSKITTPEEWLQKNKTQVVDKRDAIRTAIEEMLSCGSLTMETRNSEGVAREPFTDMNQTLEVINEYRAKGWDADLITERRPGGKSTIVFKTPSGNIRRINANTFR